MRYHKKTDIMVGVKKLLLLILLLCMMFWATGSGFGQNPGEQEKAASRAEGVSVAGGMLIQSLNFKKDIGIREALSFLAARYQKNIVPSAKVDGTLAFTSLFDVTFAEAMDAILGVDFKYEQKGNLITVYTKEEYNTIRTSVERMVYKVFTLYYIRGAEALKLVTPLLSEKGKIEVTTAAEIGVPTDESISASAGGGDTTALNDTIIAYDYPENIAKVEKVIASIDVKPKQVLVEATILSATLTEEMQFGIDWNTLKGTAITAVGDITRGTSDYFSSSGTSQVTATGGMIVGFSSDNIAAIIQAVEEVTDIDILANNASDKGYEASINIIVNF